MPKKKTVQQNPIPTFQSRTENQKKYYSALRKPGLVFARGPAGTGKTHVAAHRAAELLESDPNFVLFILRPNVAVDDEELGFFPGSLAAKTAPWLAPLQNEIGKVSGAERLRQWQTSGRIRLVNIAMIRGETYENCMVHLTEGQNMTIPQAKVLVTRMGERSWLVIEGDEEQSDIKQKKSGLTFLVETASFCNIDHGRVDFTPGDCVRSPSVKRWVQAFAKMAQVSSQLP